MAVAAADFSTWLSTIGAGCFGVVIGWTAYYVLRRSSPKAITDIAALATAVGGGAVLVLYDKEGPLFGAYSIGLLLGFFAYFAVFYVTVGKKQVAAETPVDRPGILGGDRDPSTPVVR